RVFCARVFGKPLHETFCLRKDKGRRSAERRIRITNRTTPTNVTACRCSGCGERHGRSALPRASASGALAFRRSVAALARLLPLAQLRAALTGILQQLAPPQTPFTSELLAPRSLCRRGRVRSRPGAVCETARRRRSSLHLQDRIRNVPFDERAWGPVIIVAETLSTCRVMSIDFTSFFQDTRGLCN